MKLISLLICLSAVGFAVQQSSTAEDQSVADIFQDILSVEASLKEQFKTKWAEKQQQHEEQKQQAIKALNSTLEVIQTKLKQEGEKIKSVIDEFRAAKEAEEAEKKEKFQEIAEDIKQVIEAVKTKKQNEKAEKEQEIKELAEQLKSFYEKRREQKEIENQQNIEAARQAVQEIIQKWQDFKAKLDNFVAEKAENDKKKLENAVASLNELKVLVVNEMQARADRNAAKQAEHDAKKTQYENDLKSIFDSLKTEEGKLAEQYETFKAKKDSFKQTVEGAIKEDWDFNVNQFFDDQFQKVLDKEAVKIVFKDKVHEKIFPTEPESAAVNAVGRATILDEITGTSQWQTVTWILLVLAIILAVALVAMIFYNISQRNNYQRLDGHDVESHPSNERTPIVSNVVPPIGYSEITKRGLVGPSTAIPSTSVTPPGPSAPTGEQQF